MSLSFSSSEVRALFSETSNSLMFFPTIFSSSSSSFTVASASSALSTARSRLTSVIASLREDSSYFVRVLGDHLSLGERQLQLRHFVLVVHVQVVQYFALSLGIVGGLRGFFILFRHFLQLFFRSVE